MIIFIAELNVLCFRVILRNTKCFSSCFKLKCLSYSVLTHLQCVNIFFCVCVSVPQIQLFQLSFCIGGTL